RGPRCDEIVAGAGLALPGVDEHAHVVAGDGDLDGLRGVRAPWDATAGIDLFVPAALVDTVSAKLVDAGATLADDDAYETTRIEHGVLVFGRDIDDTTIAQEAELELDAVSFTKGCFVGQELVCRIDT